MWELNTPYNLLICQKSKIDDWVEHFKQHYDGYNVIRFDKQLLENIPAESILVVNYETAWRRMELLKLRDFTLMLDESSKIKNEKSNQTKFILQLKPDGVILLSGTPIGGKYEEIWSQCRLLGWNISKELFYKQFVIQEWDDRNQKYVITGYKNIDRLKAKLRKHGAIFMKTEEAFDLPEQNFIQFKVESSKEYKQFFKEHIVEIGDEVLVGDTTSSKRLYLRMLCGHYNENKLRAFEDLVSSTNDRLIVFYNFKKELLKLKEIVSKFERPISEVNGDVKDLSNYEMKDDSITLIQYQAGAKGLNLQKSNKIVYFTPTDKCEDWMQSQKRTHRIGQKSTCFYYQLICKNSIEEKMYEALSKGVDFTDFLFEKVMNDAGLDWQ